MRSRAGSAGAVDDLVRVALQRPQPWVGVRATTAQWHADRRARRPKAVKLAADPRCATDVQDRLAGVMTTLDGTQVAGLQLR